MEMPISMNNPNFIPFILLVEIMGYFLFIPLIDLTMINLIMTSLMENIIDYFHHFHYFQVLKSIINLLISLLKIRLGFCLITFHRLNFMMLHYFSMNYY